MTIFSIARWKSRVHAWACACRQQPIDRSTRRYVEKIVEFRWFESVRFCLVLFSIYCQIGMFVCVCEPFGLLNFIKYKNNIDWNKEFRGEWVSIWWRIFDSYQHIKFIYSVLCGVLVIIILHGMTNIYAHTHV